MTQLLLFLLTYAGLAWPQTPVKTVVDFLKETPAYVYGDIKIKSPWEIHQGKLGILNVGMKVMPNESVNYTFNEEHLALHSDKGIILTIAGAPIKVKKISYDEKTKKFSVKTDTPMGIGEKTLNKKVADEIDRIYKPRMERAFKELKKIRQKKSLSDVRAVSDTVIEILSKPDAKGTMPDFDATMGLAFHPKTDRNLKLDKLKAEFKGSDTIFASFGVKRRGPKLSISSVTMSSVKGIRISGKTKVPELASINFKSLSLDSTGLNTKYDIGAEEVVAGLALTLKLLTSGGNPQSLDCVTMPKFKGLRDRLDTKFRTEVRRLIRLHEKALLAQGVEPALLAALR
jgi:hypothetical protein